MSSFLKIALDTDNSTKREVLVLLKNCIRQARREENNQDKDRLVCGLEIQRATNLSFNSAWAVNS